MFRMALLLDFKYGNRLDVGDLYHNYSEIYRYALSIYNYWVTEPEFKTWYIILNSPKFKERLNYRIERDKAIYDLHETPKLSWLECQYGGNRSLEMIMNERQRIYDRNKSWEIKSE